MSGKASRAKGHQAERDVARWFRDAGYPDACTTRQKLGHDGSRQPGDVDVCDGSGLVCEVKCVAASAWPSWVGQQRRQALDRPWLVVRKTPGKGDPGEWVACLPGYVGGPSMPARNARPTEWLRDEPRVFWPEIGVTFCTLAEAERIHRVMFGVTA